MTASKQISSRQASRRTSGNQTAGRCQQSAANRKTRPGAASTTAAAKRGGSARAAGQPRSKVRVGSPDGVLAVVPHLLGFYPSRSLVVLGLAGAKDRVKVAFRYDLPDPPDQSLAADIAEHAAGVLGRQQVKSAVVLGYGPDTLVAPVAGPVLNALIGAGMTIREVLRAEGGRYWSALCENPACCPPEGVPYDPASHPASLTLAGSGMTVFPDRAALARTLQPAAGSTAAIRAAADRAVRRLAELTGASEADGDVDPVQRAAEAGLRTVRQALTCYRTGGKIADIDQLAWLAVMVADLRVRDDAWARMDPAYRLAHQRLWTDVLRAAPAEFVPAPAALLAFTAWQSGDGALASVAIERALGADPSYSMALLLADAIGGGLPPSAARLPMTPAEVAASYQPTAETADDR